jgi:hypothetical protein
VILQSATGKLTPFTKEGHFMPDTSQREVTESVFERNQRREAEINNALKQEAARREDVIRNMHRLRALRLARDEELRSTMSASSEAVAPTTSCASGFN